jgi:amino acid transporter
VSQTTIDTADASEGLKREAGFLALLFTSTGSIIGSGWMFGALTCAQIAGPAALFSWIIGSVVALLLAMVFAELGGLFPVTGGTARFPHYAFGNLAGASFGWFSWLQAVGTAPIEVEAALQYSSNFIPGIAHTETVSGNTVTILSPLGIVIAALLLLFFVVLNLYGIRRLTQANNAITSWKVIVPTLTIFTLALSRFHGSNFSAHGFAPFGTHGVLAATSAGAVFSLVGFEQCVQLGGESKNPQRDIPRAVIGSMLIGAVLYFALQVVFIAALPSSAFAHGWGALNFPGDRGPLAGLAEGLGLMWLVYLLYADAIIAPSGSALCYITTTSRITFGMSMNGQVPAAFEKTTKKEKVPIVGLLFAWVMGLFLFLPFPGWQSLVGFITSATVLMYAGGPLALGALRKQKPDLYRPFRLPWAQFWGPVSFVAAGLIIYWSGWGTVWKLMVAVVLGYVLMGVSRATHANPVRQPWDMRAAIWLWPYLAGMTLISYLGNFGGNATIPYYWDMVVIAAFSLVIYYVAISLRLPEAEVDRYAADVYPVES